MRLFQEDLRDSPFWMMVACSLVNQTTWKQAKPAHGRLREMYAGPTELAFAGEELEAVIEPLGLWRRRANLLRRMAAAWCAREPRTAADVLRLPGCGKYAADSWLMFVVGALPDREPSDHYLKHYYLKKMEERGDGELRSIVRLAEGRQRVQREHSGSDTSR